MRLTIVFGVSVTPAPIITLFPRLRTFKLIILTMPLALQIFTPGTRFPFIPAMLVVSIAIPINPLPIAMIVVISGHARTR